MNNNSTIKNYIGYSYSLIMTNTKSMLNYFTHILLYLKHR